MHKKFFNSIFYKRLGMWSAGCICRFGENKWHSKKPLDTKCIQRFSAVVGVLGMWSGCSVCDLKCDLWSKLWGARSRLYRSRFLQPNTRWKALDEIYQIDIPLHRSTRKISANFRQTFCKHFQIFSRKLAKVCIFKQDFHRDFRWFHEHSSDFQRLSFSRKCRMTLQFPENLPIFRKNAA